MTEHNQWWIQGGVGVGGGGGGGGTGGTCPLPFVRLIIFHRGGGGGGWFG